MLKYKINFIVQLIIKKWWPDADTFSPLNNIINRRWSIKMLKKSRLNDNPAWRKRETAKGREVAQRLTREERKVEVHPRSPLLYRTHVRNHLASGKSRVTSRRNSTATPIKADPLWPAVQQWTPCRQRDEIERLGSEHRAQITCTPTRIPRGNTFATLFCANACVRGQIFTVVCVYVRYIAYLHSLNVGSLVFVCSRCREKSWVDSFPVLKKGESLVGGKKFYERKILNLTNDEINHVYRWRSFVSVEM